ncbi:MAG: endonuclease/exonuclease/phosphatase family protein [Prevotella sp.]|nr:endonuclease/exonuclease/phosphatase family protein [Prevotella sp.]
MGFVRKFKKITLRIIATANILVVAVLCATGYAGHINPTAHPSCEVLSLAFPIPLLLNLGFLLFWLVFHYRYVWIPIAGFLLCAPAVRAYCPFNFGKNAPADGLKVMSLNAHIFNYINEGNDLPNPTVDYVCNSGADIVCLQEAAIRRNKEQLKAQLKAKYPYNENEKDKKREYISVYSKYPIIRHEMVNLIGQRNLCGAFYIKMGNDTLLVVNCHLEGTRLSDEERDEFGQFVRRKTDKIHKRSIFQKLSAMGPMHARQAQGILDYITQQKVKYVVLCGDFNDSPLSYAHHLLTKHLTDCYTATGCGPGFTHRAHGMLVRIDNIMCSPNLEPFDCKIDSKANISDHNPISCTLKKRQKSKK